MKKETKKEDNYTVVETVETMKPITEQVVLEAAYDPTEELPTKLEHFPIYNKYARKNKLLVKVPTGDYYPKVKVRFQRFEQPTNVLKCRIRNKDIDWSGQLIPGCVYELPMPVIKWLTNLSEPLYAEVRIKHDAGGDKYVEKTETRQVGEKARFSCMPMEFAA